MATMFSPSRQRSFAQPAASAPTAAQQRPVPPQQVRRLYGGYTIGSPVIPEAGATDAPRLAAGGAAPPARPTPPVGLGRVPSEPTRSRREFAWTTWQLSARLRDDVIFNLRQTLHWRASYCQPLPPPEQPIERSRFGLLGEQLVPQGAVTVRERLRAELRETIRTLETTQPLLVRNSWIAMHSTRLGQLCAELEQRGLDALEEVRSGLISLWD